MTVERKAYGMDFFADEGDDAGIPFENFVTALQVWSFMRPGEQATVRIAADAFGVTDSVIRTAIDGHPWMYLESDDDDATKQLIGHDGE